jgi:hypothetical protein
MTYASYRRGSDSNGLAHDAEQPWNPELLMSELSSLPRWFA